jgi:hypothetical protein
MLPLLLKCHTKLVVNKLPSVSRFSVRHFVQKRDQTKSLFFASQPKFNTDFQSKWAPLSIPSRKNQTEPQQEPEGYEEG